MRIYISVMDKINEALKKLLIILFTGAFLALCLQVFSRFVVHLPIPWTEELSRYLMVWIAFIGTGIAVRHQQLIRIEAITTLLSKKFKIAFGLVSSIVILLFCAVVFFYSLELLRISSHQTTPSLHLPMSIPYASIPVGCILIFCNTIVSFFDSTIKGEQ